MGNTSVRLHPSYFLSELGITNFGVFWWSGNVNWLHHFFFQIQVLEPSPAPPPKPASPPKTKRPRGRPRKNKSLEESEISDSEECSTDSDIMDTSEEKNRIEGAGGTDYHYFCKICQISFYKHTAFR